MHRTYISVSILALTVLVAVCPVQGRENARAAEPEEATSREAKVQDQKVFESKVGKFRILFPGTPVYKTADVNGLVMHNYESKSGDTIFMVLHVELPEVVANDPKKFLKASQEGTVAFLKGTLISAEEFVMGKHQGIAFAFRYKSEDGLGDRIYTARVILAGNTSYSMNITYPDTGNKEQRKKSADGFFGSFKLVEAK